MHLLNFHFVDKTHTTIYQIVSSAFSKPGYVAVYTFAMIVAAVHVSHGFWSAFQTLGCESSEIHAVFKGVEPGLQRGGGDRVWFYPNICVAVNLVDVFINTVSYCIENL